MMSNAEHAYVIGIDVGTSGVRTVVMNKNHEIVSGGSRCLFSELGQDHRSPELWWQGVTQALRQTLKQIDAGCVVAMSVDATSGSILPIDASGNCLATPMMYNDVITDQSILASIAAVMPLTSAAGGATSGLAKALQFATTNPAHIVHQADWIAGKLTAQFTHSDANNALKSGYDPVNSIWPDWIKGTGFNTDLFPEVSVPGTPIATLSAQVAAEFGLSSSVQLVAGTTDGCASFLATGASETGDAVTALGSTVTIKLLSDKPVFAPEYGVYSHLIGDKWLAGGASNSGGMVLEQFFSKEALSTLSSGIDPKTASGFDFYPLPSKGERFPFNDPEMLPRMQPRPDDDRLFLQGLLEGIANIELRGYQRLIDHDAPQLRTLCTVGGGSSNPVWTSIRKKTMDAHFPDLLFREPLSEEAAAGAARLAASGASMAGLW